MRKIPLILLVVLVVGLSWNWGFPPPAEMTHEEPPRLPNEYEWLKRTYPYFQADPGAYHQAYLQARELRRAAKTNPFGEWEPVGPTNIPGRISDVEFDPIRPDTVYAASATGGVFKSIDKGRTWVPIFDDQPVITIGDIGIDPTDSDIIYVGTGEPNGGHNNFAGSGLWKSTDGGETWAYSGLDSTVSIGRILVDPDDPERVYVAALGSYFGTHPERGVYRSLDGGETWEKSLFVNDSTGVVDLVMRPDDSNVLFAAAWMRIRRVSGANISGDDSGIYKSTDGGDSWTLLGSDNGLPTSDNGRIGLTISRSNPDIMYALFNNASTHKGIYSSADGGESWNKLPAFSLSTGGFTWYFGQIRVAPDDPNRVYVMDVRLNSSQSGGWSFTSQTGTHVDHHALAFHPDDPTYVINGNDGGLAISQDRGASWSRVLDFPNTQFYEIGLDASHPDRFYGGTQDNGTLRGDSPDSWRRILGGDGFYVNVEPENPNVVYAESQWGNLQKIVNGAISTVLSGINSNERTNWSTPVVMDPTDSQTLYYGTTRLYRTTNGAAWWNAVSPILVGDHGYSLIGTLSTIAAAPSDTNVIYVGTDDGFVWVSSDYADTWTKVSDTLPIRTVTRVVVDPDDAHTAYVTYSGLKFYDPEPHIFRTYDMGENWEDISGNLPDAPVNAFAVDPVDTDVLFAGTDIGAFVSMEGDGNWEALGEGMPAVSVYDMKIFYDDDNHFLLAGTHGRSMYTIDLSSINPPTAIETENPVIASIALDAPYPNPFSNEVQLSWNAPPDATVRLELFDTLGRRVTTLVDGRIGQQTASWQPTGAAAGVYFARLTVSTWRGDVVHTAKLIHRR